MSAGPALFSGLNETTSAQQIEPSQASIETEVVRMKNM